MREPTPNRKPLWRRRAFGIPLAIWLVLAIGGMALAVAAPAAADKPIPINFEESTIFGVNPCTELPHEVHLTFEGYEHVGHPNNYLYTGAFSSGWTNDGYVMDHGREHWMVNDNHTLIVTFHNMWSNEEGSRFAVNGVWRIDFDKQEETFDVRSRCIRH
jgi:hypothetical protein